MRSAKEDIQRFIFDSDALKIWSNEYFSAVAKKLRLLKAAVLIRPLFHVNASHPVRN